MDWKEILKIEPHEISTALEFAPEEFRGYTLPSETSLDVQNAHSTKLRKNLEKWFRMLTESTIEPPPTLLPNEILILTANIKELKSNKDDFNKIISTNMEDISTEENNRWYDYMKLINEAANLLISTEPKWVNPRQRTFGLDRRGR